MVRVHPRASILPSLVFLFWYNESVKYLFSFLLAFLLPVSLYGAVLSSADLKAHYAAKQFKVIIVPGHDNVVSGARFGNYREADLNLALAHHLADYLSNDSNMHVMVSREKDGMYSPWLAEYVEEHGREILAWRDSKMIETQRSVAQGDLKVVSGVPHNNAENDTGTYLYAVNKYANDTATDLVVHIHFNDYGGRARNSIGTYTGFTIYAPDTQFKNGAVSGEVARAVAARLAHVMPGSSLPDETGLVVPDQELIAIGSNNSRDGASFLVEYGYIYEPQLRSSILRSLLMKEYAYQTATGIKDYLATRANPSFETTLLPAKLTRAPKQGEKGTKETLLLQYILRADGSYPPYPLTLSECPMNGNFGDCTLDALVIFQEKHFGYSTGAVGSQTLARLNNVKVLVKR